MSPNRWLRRCVRSHAVSGVTLQALGPGSSRQRSTRWRTPPMNPDRSYCCASVPSACAVASKRISPAGCASVFGFRYRRDERDCAALGDDPVRRLAARVELPVPPRVLVGWVQDRLLEEGAVHLALRCPTKHRVARSDRGRTAAPQPERARRTGALPAILNRHHPTIGLWTTVRSLQSSSRAQNVP